MWAFLALVAILALVGNAIATPEQRAEARARIKRVQWIPQTFLAVVAIIGALFWAGAIPGS
jgi:hypothetical protein